MIRLLLKDARQLVWVLVSTLGLVTLGRWDQLQGTNPKGYVLLMRHALPPGVGDPENFNVNDVVTSGDAN